MLTSQQLAALYRHAHDLMRNADGLQPHDAFDELLKYLYWRQRDATAAAEHATVAAIRAHFARALDAAGAWTADLWMDRRIRLSDVALGRLHAHLAPVRFEQVALDIRAAALRLFLGPDLRRGLGMYLTPDPVVRAVVAVLDPPPSAAVYDPACGSGTFLVETLARWRRGGHGPLAVYGSDVNARMLLLSELNLGHTAGVTFRHRLLDALAPPRRDDDDDRDGGDGDASWPRPDSFDVIATNPPFGVYVDRAAAGATDVFAAAANRGRGAAAKCQSEVLFLAQCLRWLKPGGQLAIVVPRSVVTNAGLAAARGAIDALGRVRAVLNLPPETFATAGTQATTCVLFIEKHAARAARGDADDDDDEVAVFVGDVANVGHDATGRARDGADLEPLAHQLAASLRAGEPVGGIARVTAPRRATLQSLARARPEPRARRAGPGAAMTRALGELVELAQTGRTPARAAYTPRGTFIVKVGNLTGQGIDWSPRDRNFVAPDRVAPALLLAEGDLLLTSSAHAPRYIAQKVDVVAAIPDFVGGRATFVGEVLRLRVRPGACDPYELLAFLRAPATRARIQRMIRGQTAHLHPADLLELPTPADLAFPEMRRVLRREAELMAEMNQLAHAQRCALPRRYGGDVDAPATGRAPR